MERLRQLGAAYWSPFLTLIAGITGVLATLRTIFPGLPGPADPKTRYILIVCAVGLYLLIRFPRFANTVTRIILGPPKEESTSERDRVFIGPRSYLSGDRDRFFGRKRETDDCWREIQGSKFFILEGESGCGKSSLLAASVLPKAEGTYRVVVCRIADDPFGKVQAALTGEPYRSGRDITADTLKITINAAPSPPATESSPTGTTLPEPVPPPKVLPLLLCLDQFEELFVTVPDRVRRQFMECLKEALQESNLHIVLILRSDFVDLLIRLCREVDPPQKTLKIGSYFTLCAFRREQAVEVLRSMLKSLEPESKDPLRLQGLEDFRDELIAELLRPPRDKRLSQDDEKTVLPVELQTVGMMLESLGVSNFSSEKLRKLGGKAELLRLYVEDAKLYVLRVTNVAPEQSLRILQQLISPAQTKWLQTAKAIALRLDLSPRKVEEVLNVFEARSLVKRSPRVLDAEDRSTVAYEFVHEHLVQVLREVPDPILQRTRDAEVSLLYWLDRTTSFADTTPKVQGLWRKLRSLFAQPIPALEMVRLWHYAKDSNARVMLKRNRAGFILRISTLILG